MVPRSQCLRHIFKRSMPAGGEMFTIMKLAKRAMLGFPPIVWMATSHVCQLHRTLQPSPLIRGGRVRPEDGFDWPFGLIVGPLFQ